MTYLQKEKEYETSRRQKIERNQRIFALVSILSFGGSMIFGLVQLFGSLASKPPESVPAKTEVPVQKDSPLANEARGYEIVLKQEPENQTALEGLVNVRIKMNDFKGAVVSLEKLIKLHPDRQDYKTLLQQLNEKEKANQKP